VVGGPLAGWLIRRHKLQGGALREEKAEGPAQAVPQRTLIETLLLMAGSMAIGLALYGWIGDSRLTLPSFIWALLVGVALRNLLSMTGIYRIDDRALDLLGGLSLSLFLAMIIMTLKLWELIDLAGPILVILLAQTAAMLCYVVFVTFRVMGRNYDAALLATGHMGFALGSTATAMVNVQAVAARFGDSQLAFLVIPVMGAFLIDIANALIIQGYLLLPWFSW
jgi:ESS family glutamate:Na+ symporter